MHRWNSCQLELKHVARLKLVNGNDKVRRETDNIVTAKAPSAHDYIKGRELDCFFVEEEIKRITVKLSHYINRLPKVSVTTP